MANFFAKREDNFLVFIYFCLYRKITMNELKSDDELAFALRALGHPVRLNILRIIAQKCSDNCCCSDVTKSIDLAQSTISQHIKVLLDAKLIKRKSKGTKNCYTICRERLKKVQFHFDNYLREQTKKIDNNE